MPEILSNLPNIALLWNEIAADLIRPEMKFFIFVAVFVVLIHGMLVLLIMTAFHQINKHNINRYQKQVDVLVYFSVVLLIFVSHLLDIFIWTYAMVNLEIFPSALKTFYFADFVILFGLICCGYFWVSALHLISINFYQAN